MRCALILIAAALLSPIAFSADIYVPDDYSKIQDAINAAVDGDTVIVRPGTYVENIDFVGKAITVKSEMGADVTTIDGNQAGSVVTFVSDEGLDSLLDGFTIVNGSGTLGPWGGNYGGGIYCHISSPSIQSNHVTGSIVTEGGGGICCWDSSPILSNNVISDNIANASGSHYEGGGVYLIGSYTNPSYPVLTNNIIMGNSAYNGAGIYCTADCFPDISYNVIDDNTSASMGDCAGGILVCSYGPTTISHNIISNNIGSGIFTWSDDAHISYNLIIGNQSYGYGGGITCISTVTIANNIVCDNEGNQTGGIDCWYSNSIIINNIILRNTASGIFGNGGGISCQYSSPVIVNNVIAYNSAYNNGGGIYCKDDCSPTITNNTIKENSASTSGGGLYFYIGMDYINPPCLINSILWDNQSLTGPEAYFSNHPTNLTISYSDVKGGQSSIFIEPGGSYNWGPGNIDADPLFVDATNDDFHITWNSPCMNSGDNTAANLPSEDFEGDPRIAGAYGRVDMGADEFHLHLYSIGDVIPGSPIQVKVVGVPGTTPLTLGLAAIFHPVPT